MIEIVEPGPLTTVQDRGRAGWAALGVPRSGAFDRRAAALANRLVGNPPDAALLEITLGGLAVRLRAAATVAATGAPCRGIDWNTAVSLPRGAELRLGAPTAGARSYLAVRGGLAVEPVLGSRSTDLLSGLGPDPLRTGDQLPVGPPPHDPPSGETAAPPATAVGTLRLHPGPRADWLRDTALLQRAAWTVRPDSDRVGVRLDGPRLRRADDRELPSEPVLPGAVQLPAGGRPIVFGPDAPVTGGYPVVAVLADADLDLLAQLRPGDSVRFSPATGAG